MAIKVYNNKIAIGNYVLQEGSGGLVFDGIIGAESFLREGTFQGRVAGFNAAGWQAGPTSNVIDKFPFATTSFTALDQGDLTVARYGCSSFSSDSYGYTAGGYATSPAASSTNVIDKFPFNSSSNATDVGDLNAIVYSAGGNSSKQFGNGYMAGSNFPTFNNTMERVPFSTDTNSFDIGDLSVARGLHAGQSSNTHAYNSGGEPTSGSAGVNIIDKFPMAATSYVAAIDVGDLTQGRGRTTGQSSLTHGYTSGGSTSWPGNAHSNVIDKFPFSSDANATDVGDLTGAKAFGSGISSVEYGYYGGGATGTGSATTTVERFPFANDANGTSVGNLSVSRGYISGTQI